jgi:hypothetical protein
MSSLLIRKGEKDKKSGRAVATILDSEDLRAGNPVLARNNTPRY